MSKTAPAALAAFALVLALAHGAFADGMPVPSADYIYDITMPEQKAVIYWDGTEEQLILSTKISLDSITDFAWVVPIQSGTKPEVEEADEKIFIEMAELFRDRGSSYSMELIPALGSAAADTKVKVIETKKIDIYDITILQATNSKVLLDWLNDNNYSFPKDRMGVLTYYTWAGKEGRPYYFVANRINLSNKYPGIEITDSERECLRLTGLVEGAIYDPNILKDFNNVVREQFGFYSKNYPACADAGLDAFVALAEISLGISTPLKYTFAPAQPTYPMRMTAAGNGETTAIVYVAGETCLSDSDGFLALDAETNSVQVAKDYGFGRAECITKLSFSGDANSLYKDSFFEETRYNPSLDPLAQGGASAVDFGAGLLFTALLVSLIFVLFVLPSMGIFFACGVALVLLERRFGKPLLWRAIAAVILVFVWLVFEVMLFTLLPWAATLLLFFFIAGVFSGHHFYNRNQVTKGLIVFIALLALLFLLFFAFFALLYLPLP